MYEKPDSCLPTTLTSKLRKKTTYCKTYNMRHTSVGNIVTDHSDATVAAPPGAATTTSSFSTQHLTPTDRTKQPQDKKEIIKVLGLGHLMLGISWYFTFVYWSAKPAQRDDMCRPGIKKVCSCESYHELRRRLCFIHKITCCWFLVNTFNWLKYHCKYEIKTNQLKVWRCTDILA